MWNATTLEEITPEMCTIFTVYKPKIELILFGTGLTAEQLPNETKRYLTKNNLYFETMPSVNNALNNSMML